MRRFDYSASVNTFRQFPYKRPPYNSRNWGNPLHSLCSYQGKLKPAIAHFLIKEFTEVADNVLDPLSGSGTIPLEATLLGRRAFANDLQELGFILSSAKVGIPKTQILDSELGNFLDYVNIRKWKLSNSDLKVAEFGLNGSIASYFEEQTLREILSAREYLVSNPVESVERALVYASFLHILHGNRPYALSRISHPVTPFKPNGDFEYRDIDSRLRAKVSRAIQGFNDIPESVYDGAATLGSFESIAFQGSIDAVITSPPFAGSTRFYIANWMRLWAAGWEPEDFRNRRKEFIEDKQKTSFNVYEKFFESCSEWLKTDGKLILHLGKTQKINMADEVMRFLPDNYKLVGRFDETLLDSETFGIRDQGATSSHQFLFLQKTN